ncbi:uncharacterized protein LOC122349571 [Puntigrus tetrazona]|uniref:uncharacterized protein LOC122349571 n=1 Tax=Puntigrus tetrazona TaxID=1606681 RepID=UPI001C8A1222|nr:uncharacterized protein LOC122349571 [Puntigrus tetrazona]
MLQTVTSYTDCNAYRVVIHALSGVFDQITSLRQQELAPVMLGYLKQHYPWSSSCWSGTGGLGAWLEESFGKFSIYVDYQDLRVLNAGFDSFESLDLLSASQVAQLTLHSGALNNLQLIELVFDRLEGGNSFQDIEEFLEALARTSQGLDISPVVRDVMMNRTFAIIMSGKCHAVRRHPDLFSPSVHCSIRALSGVFDQITSLRQQELAPVMLGYLKQHYPWNSSCWSGTAGLGAWLEESFGKFSIYVAYQDLRVLNAGFDSVRSPPN